MLEVGCGTGVLSCLAARLGAKRVYAVEPTGLASVARDLAGANGVADRVVVLEGRVEDLDPRPVDFGFSELLNAFPFQEGVLPAMEAAAAILSGSPVSMSYPSTRAVLSCTYSLIHFCVGAKTLALVLSTAEELVGLQQNARPA